MNRNVWGIHTDITGMDINLLRRSALIKVLFEPRDAHVVKSWAFSAQPNAYWLYRSPIDLDSPSNPGELQRRYFAIGTSDFEGAHALGVWYAEWMGDWIKPNGMEYFFLEAGPNEANDSSQRAIGYSLGFTERCIELGLRPAPGLYSFGHPKIKQLDGFNGWSAWKPVLDAINKANAGNNEPRAAFQLHEYALAGDMLASMPHAIGRYQFMPYDGPIMIGEFGYADYIKPTSTEIVLSQICAINERLGQDDRLCGFAWYDIRQPTDNQYNYMYGDICRVLDAQGLPTLPITVKSGSIIEVPPDPEPPTQQRKHIIVKNPGVNMRASHTMDSEWLGMADEGSEFVVEYPAVNEYVRIPSLNCWIWGNNIKEI